MLRKLIVGAIVSVALCATALSQGSVGTAAEAKAMLEKAVTELKANETDTLRVFLAERTFEWDLAKAGNWETLIEALALVKPKVASGLNPAETG